MRGAGTLRSRNRTHEKSCSGGSSVAEDPVVTVGQVSRDLLYPRTIRIGCNACYEWQMEDEAPLLFRMTPIKAGETRGERIERPTPPDRADWLPPSIGRYTRSFVYGKDEHHLSFEQGGGHHGSHPHLVHEFIQSIIENRKPAIDAVTAANLTAVGICAHESAMAGGHEVVVPAFDNKS